MSDMTTVNFDVLASGATQIKANFSRLQTALEQLENQLNPMVASWTGDAREAYFQKKAQWDSAAAAMSSILQQMGSAVDTAHGNYQAAENANRSRWA